MSTIKENLSNNMSAPTNSTPTTPIDALSSPLVLPNDISEKILLSHLQRFGITSLK